MILLKYLTHALIMIFCLKPVLQKKKLLLILQSFPFPCNYRDLQNNSLQGLVPDSLGELENLHFL